MATAVILVIISLTVMISVAIDCPKRGMSNQLYHYQVVIL